MDGCGCGCGEEENIVSKGSKRQDEIFFLKERFGGGR